PRFFALMAEAAARTGQAAPESDAHAGGLETSTMLAERPELVRPFEGVEGYTAAEPGWLERVFAEGIRPLSASGVLGDVAGANARAGEAIFAALADELAAFFVAELRLCARPDSALRGPKLVRQPLRGHEPGAALL